MQQTNPVVDEYGTRRWFEDGQLHRLDGPAVEYKSGDLCWYRTGLLHRLDGPSIEYRSGERCWYIDDVSYTEEQFRLVAFVMSQVGV